MIMNQSLLRLGMVKQCVISSLINLIKWDMYLIVVIPTQGHQVHKIAPKFSQCSIADC